VELLSKVLECLKLVGKRVVVIAVEAIGELVGVLNLSSDVIHPLAKEKLFRAVCYQVRVGLVMT